MPIERTGAYRTASGPKTLVGPELRPGDRAPDFTAMDQNFATVTLQDTAGRVRIFAVVPSLDTGVCDQMTRRFEMESAQLGDAAAVYTVSVDTPYAQKRWCGAAEATHVQLLSDLRDNSFGPAYGVRTKETGLLARAVFVVDRDGVVRHAEYCSVMGDLPDFDRALAVARSLL